MFKEVRSLIFIFAFALFADSAWAKDERSINGLHEALVALAPEVDPAEAELVSRTAHTTSRRLAREYRVVGPPAFHNFLIHRGVRQRGFCYDWVRDIAARLKEHRPKTLELHWGASFVGTYRENNCLVVTARGQPFHDGIIIDAWRHAGRLCWMQVTKDRKNAWVEDMGETAWLQDYGQPKRKPKRATAQR